MWRLEMPHILGKHERGKYETGLTDIQKELITKAVRWMEEEPALASGKGSRETAIGGFLPRIF